MKPTFAIALILVTSVALAQPGIGITKDSTLQGTGSSGSALGINPANTQRRVTGTCTAGNAIRVVNENGTVTCEATGDAGGVAGSGTGGRSTRWTDDDTVGTGAFTDNGSAASIGGTLTMSSSTAANPSAIFGSGGRGWYVLGNELNQGHSSAISDTGFLNYSGHAGGTTQFRSLWVGNGKNAAAPILYVNGVNNRVGVNTASPSDSLHVSGTGRVTGNVTLDANLTNSGASGTLQWGPLGGGGGLLVNRTTGGAGFIPFTDTANPWGFGFGTTSSVTSLIGLKSMTFAPGTANPRTDSNVTLIDGLATSQYDTTAGDLLITDFFLDSSHIKQAGANALNNVLMRLDANGPLQGGGVRHATALWIDKGEFRNSGHTTYAVRPSTGGGPTAPPVISACGTSPTRTGNDNGGRITVGSGGPTSCTLTFQLAWVDHTATGITPVCLVVNKEGVATGLSWTESSTTLVISWTGGSPTTLSWHCFGLDDAVPGP